MVAIEKRMDSLPGRSDLVLQIRAQTLDFWVAVAMHLFEIDKPREVSQKQRRIVQSYLYPYTTNLADLGIPETTKSKAMKAFAELAGAT